ncbi:MAG: hypothetical protein M3209_17065 [Acidobacteriota bacterium]|nr:hypothetical protein [Acidobacteriota bacterium]
MKQRILRTLVILTLAACLNGLTFNNSVFACECRQRNDFEQEFSFSKAVFVGEVVEIDKSTPDAVITFEVEKVWKGSKSRTIAVRTNNQGKACGFNFRQGEKYLIYAYDDGVLRTSICTRTAEIKSADNDLKKLAKKKEL